MAARVARSETPRDVEARVLDIVTALAAELGTLPARGAAAPDDVLDRDLGLGSLERVELALRLEQAFDLHLADAALAEAERCRDLVDAVIRGAPRGREPQGRDGPGVPPGPANVGGLGAISGPPVPAVPPVPTVRPVPAVVPSSTRTLVEALRWHAERAADRDHIVLPGDSGNAEHITYGALWQRAVAAAAALRARGLRRGDSVAIMLRTEPAFFSVFVGTLLVGAVPVPIYPPFRASRLEEYAVRQAGILDNAEARLLVTFSEAAALAGLLRRRVRTLEAVVTAESLPASGGAPTLTTDADAVALIQYTSGSTGDPKGVVLTHANLLANIRALGEALAVGANDVFVSWLPLYHDMGLIGAWLGSLYHGIPVVLLSPLAFLARPARWLAAIGAHRGTVSAAPNFAFDLCVKRVTDAELGGVDLSTWRLALNGSEPVSADTMERFTRRFAPSGFRAEAMTPVYGLAEASVGLTVTPPGRGPRVDVVSRETFERHRRAEPASPGARAPLRFVSSGRPIPRHDVRVVDDGDRVVGERVEGRVQFRGPSVTAGYHRRPELTRAALRAGWMESGDLGYWADGELVVTGRSKDIIIKAGRNLYPQEIEDVVGTVPGVRRGCVAAVGVADPAAGTERMVVVAETRATDPAARERLRGAVVERVVDAVGLPPDTVVIASPGAVLKTSSGKIQRTATRDAYIAGTLGRARSFPRRQWLGLLAAEARGALAGTGPALRAALFVAWVGIVLALTVPPLWAAVALARHGRSADAAVRRWCRTILRVTGCGPRVRGLERLPRGGAVYVANHASYLDALALLAVLPVDLRFVAKRELLAAPIVGTVLRKVGHLTVERVDVSRSVADAEKVAAALRAGISVCIFPEGTFVRRAELLPFRLGAFKAAVESRCPVVPVGIRGTRAVMPADTWRPRPGKIEVRVTPPLPIEGEGWREMVRLRNTARAAVARSSDQGG